MVHGLQFWRNQQAALGQEFPDRGNQPAQILRLEGADAADAEALCPGQLARIDDEAACRERGIEVVEPEARILERPEGGDDGRLDALVEEQAEAKTCHPVSQGPEVVPIALQPRSRTALRLESSQR